MAGRLPIVTVTSCTSPARKQLERGRLTDPLRRQRRQQTAGAAGAAAVDLQNDVAWQHAGLFGGSAWREAYHHEAGVPARRVAEAFGDQHVLQPDAEPAAGDTAIGEQRIEHTRDGGRRDRQRAPPRSRGGHADQPTAEGQHRTALVGTETRVQPQQRLDAAAGLAVPFRACRVHHAKPAGRRTARVRTDDQRQRAGPWDRRGGRQRRAEFPRQAENGDVGARIAAGECRLGLAAVVDDGEVVSLGQ